MAESLRKTDAPGRVYAALFAAVAAAYLAFCAYINFVGFETFATPDMYSDTLIAKLMWEQKTLFPEGWVFGNQFYVLSTPVIAALFYGLTGSLNLSMVLATELMTALIIIAFIWMARPFLSTEALAGGALAMLAVVICPGAPDHLSGQLFYLMASYYACYLINVLVVCGAYMRLLADGDRRLFTPSAGLALVLSFAMGMQSIRQTAVLVLPLLFAEAALRLLRRSNRRAGLFVLLTAAANIAGLIAIRLLDVPNVSIYGEAALAGEGLLANLKEDVLALMGVTGLRSYEHGAAALCVYAAALIAAVIALPFHSLKNPLAAAAGICALGVAAALAANLVIDLQLRSIYLFTWFPLAAIAVALLINRLRTARAARAVVSLAFAALAVFNLLGCYLTPAQRAPTDENGAAERELAGYITDLGCELIYGQWYFGSRVAVRTDGAAVAATWHDAPCEILGYINPQNLYTEEDNARAVYLVAPEEKEAFMARAGELGAELMLLTSSYGIELYTSSKQLMYFGE